MSKFFVQLLLSMVVGVSAAVGLGPQAIKIRQEAKVSLREKANIFLPTTSNVTAQVKTNTSLSAQIGGKSVIKENARVHIKVKDNSNTEVNANIGGTVINNMLHQSSTNNSVNSSVNANVQTNASVNTPVVDLNLMNNIKTTLDLNSPLDLNLLP